MEGPIYSPFAAANFAECYLELTIEEKETIERAVIELRKINGDLGVLFSKSSVLGDEIREHQKRARVEQSTIHRLLHRVVEKRDKAAWDTWIGTMHE